MLTFTLGVMKHEKLITPQILTEAVLPPGPTKPTIQFSSAQKALETDAEDTFSAYF